jgi:hypothetical protein
VRSVEAGKHRLEVDRSYVPSTEGAASDKTLGVHSSWLAWTSDEPMVMVLSAG